MGKSGVEKNALNNSANAVTQAQDAYSTVNPIYSEMATGDYGLTPQQKANLQTASMQSTGGAVAGAVGQGALQAARTGNAGGSAAAIDAATRAGIQQESKNALDIQNEDAQVARQNQQTGLSGISDIYKDANATGSDYLNTANSASNAKAARTNAYLRMGLGGIGGALGA